MARLLAIVFVVSITAIASVAFARTAVRSLWLSPAADIETPKNIETTPAVPLINNPVHLPVRIRISAIGVDAAIQHVGQTAEGNMAVPTNFVDTGWYKYGPLPGERGSAVIAGHVNNGLGLSGVFERLGDLKIGDEVQITRADGSEIRFVVSATRSYPFREVPVDIIFNPQGSVHLNLITCEGNWLSDDKTYDERLVVFTTLVEE